MGLRKEKSRNGLMGLERGFVWRRMEKVGDPYYVYGAILSGRSSKILMTCCNSATTKICLSDGTLVSLFHHPTSPPPSSNSLRSLHSTEEGKQIEALLEDPLRAAPG